VKTSRFLLEVLLCLAVMTSITVTTGDRALSQSSQGVALLQQHCAMCHAIGKVGSSPHPAAPPFRRLGNSYDLDKLQEALERGTILPSHPDMPMFKMDRRTAREMVNYIGSIQE
jgi:cytochrome c